MNFTILVPHYKTGKMTAVCVHKLLESTGHKIKIIVINNSGEDIEELHRFGKKIKILAYPQDKLQSHGIAFDFAMPYVKDEYFITVESDSFPTKPDWLDYYAALVDRGYDAAGSLLKLSGGEYMHPCGAMYRKSAYEEAAAQLEYAYPFWYM